MAAYAAACVQEVAAADASLPAATSVFFGGGTPSLLPAELLVSVLSAVRRSADAEVTVECNPETVSAGLLAAYRAAGVNRLSFGAQSFVPHVLASLGRVHDVDSVARAVALARDAGFENFNLDLIFGAAGESLADWRRSLDAALALDPPHLSAYALTVEPGTPLARDSCRHPDGDDQADKYVVADSVLSAAGLEWYEISNWSRPGFECRHNLLYWQQGDYRGIGCAAHSHVEGRRWWNVRTPERYIAAVSDGRSPEAASECLDAPAREVERLQLALRTRSGVPAAALDVDALPAGLVEHVDDRVVLTRNGRLLANEVLVHLAG
jgi:oxygen-independent coproporphyrinogen-3 oxidase